MERDEPQRTCRNVFRAPAFEFESIFAALEEIFSNAEPYSGSLHLIHLLFVNCARMFVVCDKRMLFASCQFSNPGASLCVKVRDTDICEDRLCVYVWLKVCLQCDLEI